jgi:hypothetical protein
MNRYEQAVSGDLLVVQGKSVVMVDDGQDTWLADRAAYDVAKANLAGLTPVSDDDGEGEALAYGQLCSAVAGPIVTLIGSPRGSAAERAELVRRAVAEGLDVPERLRA